MATSETVHTFRVVEEDLDGDGSADLTLLKNGLRVGTVYGWKHYVLRFLSSMAALVGAAGIVQLM